MFELITATQCLKLLKDKDAIKYSKSYFSQMVSDGKIPSHVKHGSPKKFFKYEEVKQAIKDSQDPTRDAQREANNKLKEEPEQHLLNLDTSYESEADLTEEERAQRRAEKEVADAKKKALEELSLSGKDTVAPEKITIAGIKAEKEYWLALRAEHQVKQMMGELIPLADAKATIEFILTPFNKTLDDIGVNIKAHFPEVPKEAVEWLIIYINDAKEAAKGYRWEP